MLYRGFRIAARAATNFSLTQAQYSLRQLPIQLQQVRSYADKIVQVPPMAESISEGTLKQWNKKIGDFVEQDEEIATIETDKVEMTPSLLNS
jgi:2-oxoglutarate dehydrogenase E2 component (dihydrolipoamide succinyltransferase)